MSTLTLSLSETLHAELAERAGRQAVSVEEWIAAAAAEKLAAERGMEQLRQAAARGSREDLHRVLATVPDVPPVPGDEWP